MAGMTGFHGGTGVAPAFSVARPDRRRLMSFRTKAQMYVR